MYAAHRPPEVKQGLAPGRGSCEDPEMSNSTSQVCKVLPGRTKDLCSGSRAARIPRSHHKPSEIPPISTAMRFATGVSEDELVTSVDKFVSVQEPGVLQTITDRHPALAGPAELAVLQ